jgi:hypothetical protein
MRQATVQRQALTRHTGHTTTVIIGGERFSLTAITRSDGRLDEVHIHWSKHGTTGAGLMDIYATALTTGLRQGVPLYDLLHQALDMWFLPNGATDDPEIPHVRSVVDYVARRLLIDWLPKDERLQHGILTAQEHQHLQRATDWLTVDGIRVPTLLVSPADLTLAALGSAG